MDIASGRTGYLSNAHIYVLDLPILFYDGKEIRDRRTRKEINEHINLDIGTYVHLCISRIQTLYVFKIK